MSYHPSRVNDSAGSEIPSGIIFYGHTPSGKVYEASSDFTIGGGYLNVPSVILANNGTIGSQGFPNAITINSTGHVSIGKNLIVNGDTTTVNSTTLTVEDPIIILGSGTPTSGDNRDRGVSFNYYDGAAKTGFFGFDDSTGKFTFVPNATITAEVVDGASGTIVADLQGNADTASRWASTLTLELGDELSGSVQFDGDEGTSTLSASLTNAAITGLTALSTAVDGSDDYFLIYDDSATSLRKVNRSVFVSGLGTMSSFVVTDGTTSDTVSDGGTITFSDSSTINFVVSSGVGVAASLVDGSITESMLKRTIETISASKTLDKDVTLVNTTSASVTGILPENATSGTIKTVKRIDGNAAYDVVISRAGADTIDGSTSFQLYYQFETLTFISNGADWYII